VWKPRTVPLPCLQRLAPLMPLPLLSLPLPML
jgi:hypothetical protein